MPRLTIEQLCSVMHYAYEREARRVGWETQERSRVSWEELPEENKAAMVAAMTVVNDIIRKDERESFRSELMDCLNDLRMNRYVAEPE